jgi:CO/xanthine dehydrogenase Mo-binding subunit
LHGASVTSPHAHARPRHVDTHKAKALPGVHAVLSLPRCPPCIIRLRRTELPQPPAV